MLLLEHPSPLATTCHPRRRGESRILVRSTRSAPPTPAGHVPNIFVTPVLSNGRRHSAPGRGPLGSLGQDLARAREVLLATAAEVEGVSPDPEPRLLTDDLGQEARRLRLVLWVDVRRHDPGQVRSELLDRFAGGLGLS